MKTLFYKGPSMNPTFRVPDVLHVEPFDTRPIREGDVIVFTAPDGHGNVAHRVVCVCDDGSVQTMGDNNREVDAYVLYPHDVIGRVTHATRDGKRRVVHGGPRGKLVGMSARLWLAIRKQLVEVLRPVYAALSGCLAFTWLVRRMSLRVVHYSRQGTAEELHLLMGNRCIGRLLHGQTRWRITPPFRLLVDEAALPRRIPDD